MFLNYLITYGVIVLKVTSTKGKKRREIPISRSFQKFLDALPRNGEYVIQLPKRRDPKCLWDIYHEISALTGIDSFRLHDVRHTVASRLLANGADVRTVQEILGHSSIKTTMKYLHTDKERKRKALEKISL